jgi:hypothetical protein
VLCIFLGSRSRRTASRIFDASISPAATAGVTQSSRANIFLGVLDDLVVHVVVVVVVVVVCVVRAFFFVEVGAHGALRSLFHAAQCQVRFRCGALDACGALRSLPRAAYSRVYFHHGAVDACHALCAPWCWLRLCGVLDAHLSLVTALGAR